MKLLCFFKSIPNQYCPDPLDSTYIENNRQKNQLSSTIYYSSQFFACYFDKYGTKIDNCPMMTT